MEYKMIKQDQLPALQQPVVMRSLSEQITGVVCDFCDKVFEVKDVYFLADREDRKTVICERCESKHGLVF